MSLARKAVSGVLWTISSSIFGKAIGLAGTLLLTHFISPNDYGEVHTAHVVVGSALSLVVLGVGQYVVAHPKAGPDVVFHATFYHVITGALVLGLLLAFADHLLVIFPKMGGMLRYLPWLVLASMVGRIAYLPTRVLTRDMRFRVLAIRSFANEVIYTGVLLTLLVLGFGAWSVLWAMVARTVVVETFVILSVNWREWIKPTRLSWKTTRELMAFLPLGAANVLHFLSRRGDNLLFASLFGPNAVGAYNLAYNLADIPASHVGEHIGDVLLPSFANLKTDDDRKRALNRAAGLLSLVVFPLAVGLGAIAHTLVAVLFNEEWASVAPMLVVLSALSIMRPVGWLVQSYLQAMKRPRVLLMLEIVRTVVLFASIFALSSYGVLWACYAVGIAYGINAFASLWFVNRHDEVGIMALLKPYLPPLWSCIPMVLAVLGMRRLLSDFGVSSAPMLVCEILTGAVTYVAGALLIARSTSRDLIRLLLDLVRARRRRAEAAQEGAADSEQDASEQTSER